MTKKSVAVQIAGHEYKIRSDSDEASLRQLALYVDQAMARVRKGTGTVDSLDVAVLTCLNLAREILTLNDHSAGGIDDGSLRALIESVEAVLPGQVRGEAEEVDGDSSGERNIEDTQSTSEPAKTLELPSIETLHGGDDASSSTAHDEALADDTLPEARMAAGGRDRAS